MIFVIGGRGRLGQAIIASYPNDNVISINRHIYQDWWQNDSQDKISHFFEPWSDSNSIVFVTAGILDPRISQEEHLKVNYLLPRHLIEGATKVGLRVVTFGTVMERLIANKNPYIYSKAMLGNYVSDFSAAEKLAVHLRVHTLYGIGQPSPFMFLGQIYHALRNQVVFEMSPGNQLREYHHIDDEVRAIGVLVEAETNGILDLSHGEPVSLKAIASYIFKAFNAESLLRVGALQEPKEENYGTVFQRSDLLLKIEFRKTLPAIVNYLKACSLEIEKLT